jgi:putative FmdB family regulatory protein
MPTYEYVCRSCGEPLEVVQAFTDAALEICPRCGGELRKVFGNVGVVFKGSGFYKTDSRSANGVHAKAAGDSPSASERDTPATPAEAAPPSPAATPDAKPAASPSPPAPSAPSNAPSGASTS